MPAIGCEKNIVELNDVSFSYGKGEVVSHVNLAIHRGDYLGIIGPNGAGKTTLLRLMLGLLTPDTGSVKLLCEPIAEFKEWRRIGYVPQKATNFDAKFPATVAEIVLMGRYAQRGLFHMTNAADKKIVKKVLIDVDMWEYRDRLIGDLSGGQQQRVFIARALATQPEMLFLDEPTAGIDAVVQKDFYTLLDRLNKELGLTLVLISHDILTIAQKATHIAYINKTLDYHGSPKTLLKDQKLIQAMIHNTTHH